MMHILDYCEHRVVTGSFDSFYCTHEMSDSTSVTPDVCSKCVLNSHSRARYDSGGDTFWEKTKSLAEGAIGVTKAALGIDQASQETKKSRWEICKTCEKNDLGVCVACGCWISPKISLSGQSCPLGLWGKE